MRKCLLAVLSMVASALFAEVEPTVAQDVELTAGWNLVRLEGTPLMSSAFRKLLPHCYDAENNAYVRCTDASALKNGSVVWLYCATAHAEAIALDGNAPSGAEPEPSETGWSLVGAAVPSPAWLPQAAQLYLWDARQFHLKAAAPQAGQGAWVNRK